MNTKRFFLVLCAIGMIACLSACKSKDYNKAVEFQEAGDYTAALEIFETIHDYKDSSTRIDVCKSMISAIEKFNIAQDAIEKKNTEFDAAIHAAEDIVLTNLPALDDTLLPKLETAISNARGAKKAVPEMPDDADQINAIVEELNLVDYENTLTELSELQAAFEKSAKQYEQVNAPTEIYVTKCLRNIPHIVDISAVTENNDPNGKLNKAGGYTAQIYFSSDLIDQSSFSGATIIERGTACGGSIEVYANPEDANKRNEYLSTFDGTLFDSGSHIVIGTIVIRTSNKLIASDQKILEQSIIMALTQIDE